MSLPEQVRRHCAEVARTARSVRIDLDASTASEGIAGLNAEQHFLEGSLEQVARYVLVLDTINFGSGWFPTLNKRAGSSGYFTVSWGLADHYRAHGAYSAADLRAVRADEIAAVLGLTVNNVHVRLSRARAALRAALGEAP